MKLARREIVTIALGGAIAVAAVLYRVAGDGAAGSELPAKDTIAGALARIEDHKRLERSVVSLSKELGIEIPAETVGDQETKIRQDISRHAQTSGVQMTSIRRVEGSRGGRTTTVRPIEFSLEVTGLFTSAIGFVYTLEHASLPYVVREVRIDSAGSGRNRAAAGGTSAPGAPQRNSRGQQARGRVRASMKVQSYLFPDVALAEAEGAKEETKKNETSAGAPGEKPSPTPEATSAGEEKPQDEKSLDDAKKEEAESKPESKANLKSKSKRDGKKPEERESTPPADLDEALGSLIETFTRQSADENDSRSKEE